MRCQASRLIFTYALHLALRRRLLHTGIVKLLITIVQDEDGKYIAECPAIPGCVSQGKTEQEAEINIRDAIRECLEVRAALGMPLTVTTREIEVPA
jgi:predicted RNase H-like HicB family nuclease